ncbi:hypothetical protein RND81_13G164000 [Saponaria officinalis]|uniref:Uncharacterized protein n=1 Tax=Saponaria officinalis TaxID=3572 RepID=A0AAW1H5Z5_SAPOF
MGQCRSSTLKSFGTAKLILQDGSLEEFSYPTKVSTILSTKPNTFICNSDEMEFDDVITAVKDNDELQLGQLYFALPLSKLNRRLSAEEMVSLAVKANAALLKRTRRENFMCRKKTGFLGGGGGGEREWKTLSPSLKVADFGADSVKIMKNGNRSGNGRRRGRSMTSGLSVIHE